MFCVLGCYAILIFHNIILYVQYVDPVLERLDTKGFITGRLSRPATKYQDGKHYRVRILGG